MRAVVKRDVVGEGVGDEVVVDVEEMGDGCCGEHVIKVVGANEMGVYDVERIVCVVVERRVPFEVEEGGGGGKDAGDGVFEVGGRAVIDAVVEVSEVGHVDEEGVVAV